MAVTKTEISNMALGMLGAQLLSDFDTDQSNAGRLCRLYYPTALNCLLEDMPYTFAVKQIVLSTELQDAPLFGYSVAYELPDDFIQIVETEYPDSTWQIHGHTIHTNDSSFKMRYVYALEDTNRFSAHFTQALTAKMAMLLAMGITRNPDYVKMMGKLYEEAVAYARHRDSMQDSRRTDMPDTLTIVRF